MRRNTAHRPNASARTLGVAALCLAALSACASQSPPVDEERIARRVVALLRREGLVVAVRDGGVVARPHRDDSEPSEEGDDPDDEETADEDGDGAAEPTQAAGNAQAEQLMRALQASAARAASQGGALRERITEVVTPPHPSVVTGERDAALAYVPLEGSISIGPDDALVTVVTFTDAQCPFCGRLMPTLRDLQRAHPNEVRLVMKHYPLAFHRAAWTGAVYVEFARSVLGADGAFRAMEQCHTHTNQLDRMRFDLFASELGLDPIHLADALDAQGVTDFDRAVARDYALGDGAHVSGTPATFFNGRLVTGAQPREAIDRAYEDALDRARRALSRGVRRNALYEAVCRSPDAPTAANRRTPARAP